MTFFGILQPYPTPHTHAHKCTQKRFSHRNRVTHRCVRKLGNDWFRLACRRDSFKPSSEPMLAYCQLDPWQLTSVKYWIDDTPFENVVRKISAIWFRPQCVKGVQKFTCTLHTTWKQVRIGFAFISHTTWVIRLQIVENCRVLMVKNYRDKTMMPFGTPYSSQSSTQTTWSV